MQDTLSKVLINLASGSLLTVLVLYLVLHKGAGMQTQQVVLFKEMQEQRSRHQVLGRMRVGETVQTPTMERLCKLHYFPVQGPCLVSNNQIHGFVIVKPYPQVSRQK
jgi:hypothetical protein